MFDDIGYAGATMTLQFSRSFLAELAEGDFKSLALLQRLLPKNLQIIELICLKHLRGSRVWELYEEICGRQMDRFIYHVMLELPCQCCGRFNFIPVEYATSMGFSEASAKSHWLARQHGKPNSFWALEDPPTERNYQFPIIIFMANIIIE